MPGNATLAATPLPGLPEVRPGDDLAVMIAEALSREANALGELRDNDLLVVAHKVISKAEGRIRHLAEIEPGERARLLSVQHDKDPRHVQAVLDESVEVLRAARGTLVCVTRHGFVCANAGVDRSNVAEPESVVLLPRDPDRSARALRLRLRELTGACAAVVITDSFGRAWRHGQSEVAIGCAGLAPLEDWRGRPDSGGRQLRATWIAIADEAAAAADLVRRKDSREPVVLVRGLERHVAADDGPGAAALVRPEQDDLFR
ncbi:MAG: coenzyme F420-0:L-glutamate ligase [Solirubrobacterales bacterium]|nr:coenzyme F420-0:L-glutamate ligase [Solirubrobacterales bacterium]MBV9536405.1 coenzyme F420-0:L-glutamate ligase [Solirubrobacterales bacterium]